MTAERWLLSNTGEITLSLQQPLEIIVDSSGVKSVTTTGDLLLIHSDAEPASEIELNFDILPGTPLTVIGTQGTVKIID